MEAIFDALVEHVKNVIETRMDNENAVMALRKTERDIELALGDCKSAHTKLLAILNEASAENEIECIRGIQTRYNETLKKFKLSPPRQKTKTTPDKIVHFAWKKLKCHFLMERSESILNSNRISKNK